VVQYGKNCWGKSSNLLYSKAIRSAFVCAGCPQVPWAKSQDDKKENRENVKGFIEELEKTFSNCNRS